MSIPLRDFRCAIPESVDIWLEAEAAAFGLDKAAVAREVLLQWAKRKAHAHRVATKRLATNGMQPELDGFETADGGAERNGATPGVRRR